MPETDEMYARSTYLGYQARLVEGISDLNRAK